MESPHCRKIELRRQYRFIREKIAQQRRKEASKALLKELADAGRILSFDPIGSEIDPSPLNQVLAKRGALFLNRVEDGRLVPYLVECLETLVASPSFSCKEPDPKICPRADLNGIDLILAPGLAFDRDGYRLGYGQGFYDALFAMVSGIATRGVGFIEQLSAVPLPKEPWDRPVDALLLF